METTSAEHRRQERTRAFTAQGLKIHCYGRAIPAVLVDASDGGLGLEMFVALSPGIVVSFEGQFENEDLCLALSGTAQVAHCIYSENGVYRVGLAFQEVCCQVIRGERPVAAVLDASD